MTQKEQLDPEEFLKNLLNESEKTNTSFIDNLKSEKNIFATRVVSNTGTKKYDYLYTNSTNKKTTATTNKNNNSSTQTSPWRKGSFERTKSNTTTSNKPKTTKTNNNLTQTSSWRKGSFERPKKTSTTTNNNNNNLTQTSSWRKGSFERTRPNTTINKPINNSNNNSTQTSSLRKGSYERTKSNTTASNKPKTTTNTVNNTNNNLTKTSSWRKGSYERTKTTSTTTTTNKNNNNSTQTSPWRKGSYERTKSNTTTTINNSNNNSTQTSSLRKGSYEITKPKTTNNKPNTTTTATTTIKKVGTWNRQERKQDKKYTRLNEKKTNTTTTKPTLSKTTKKTTEPKGSNWGTPPIKRNNSNKQIGSFNSLSSPQRFISSNSSTNTTNNNRNDNTDSKNTRFQSSKIDNQQNNNSDKTQFAQDNNNNKNNHQKGSNQNQTTYLLADPEKIYRTIEIFLEEQNKFTEYYLEPLKKSELITDNQFIPLFSKTFQYMNNQNTILGKLKNVIESINNSKSENKNANQQNIYNTALYCKIFECFSALRLTLFEFSVQSFEENVQKIHGLMKNNSKIKELFDEASKQLSVDGFNYYYTRPLDLALKYVEYFEELKQFFKKVHSSLYLTKVTRILQGFLNLSKIIGPKMVTYENIFELEFLTNRLSKDRQFNLNESNRNLILVDEVDSQNKKRTYKIFLFTDIILFTLITKKNQLLPQQLMFLKNVTVKDENDNKKLNKINAISIFLLNDETRYCFLFQSPERKSEFFHMLTKYENLSKVTIETVSSIRHTVMLTKTHSKSLKNNIDEKENKSSIPFAEETKLKKRKQVIIELVKTEEDYVNDLRTIIKHYLDPITNQKIVKEKDIPLIFSHTKMIETVNSMILDNLNKAYPQDEDEIANMNVGKIFIQIAEFLKVYTQYCSNHENAVNTVVKYSSNSSFQQLIENNKLNIPQVRNLELLDFLIKPIQRICKYPLLFRELLRSTSKNFPDYTDLKSAFLKISKVADYVNEKKRNAEEQMKVVKIHDKISGIDKKFELVKPHRRFIMEALLKKRSNRRIQQRQFWLFNDILLYAKPSFGKGKFQYKGNINLNGALLRNFDDKKKKEFKFQIVPYGSKKDYKIYCQNEEEKKIWYEKIDQIIQEFQKNNNDQNN
ncbi:faciogenital dysplasia protein [Anaeramoeba flamelloides]|uniref:Faciogenital dysplasia protein n=1 Tax=Anaeramoeba flamelloides TaxID=1746091 RepID=A0ABQ8XLE5_9EUKA|nr:faciogenital dysplasia protein [Anaeramoeba flamelloides]